MKWGKRFNSGDKEVRTVGQRYKKAGQGFMKVGTTIYRSGDKDLSQGKDLKVRARIYRSEDKDFYTH